MKLKWPQKNPRKQGRNLEGRGEFSGWPEYIPLSEIEDEEVCKKAYSDILKWFSFVLTMHSLLIIYDSLSKFRPHALMERKWILLEIRDSLLGSSLFKYGQWLLVVAWHM